MASIQPRKAKDGTVSWRVQFRIDGKMRGESFLDVKGAEQFGRLVDKVGGREARAVLEARRNRDAAMPTLREWTAEYLDIDSGRLTGIEPGTRAEYVRVAERSFLQILGDWPIDGIEKHHVGQWVAWQEKQTTNPRHRNKTAQESEGKTIAAKTVRNYHALLSSVLAAAVEAKHIEANPAHRTRMSKGQKHEGVFLSRAEFAQILTHVPESWQPFVLFLAGTGCRWGEATALNWGDLNLYTSPATVRISKAWKRAPGTPLLKHPKTSRSNRTISLWPELVQALGDTGKSDRLMFTAERGGKLWPARFHESVWKPAVRAANDAGVTKQPRIHDLRHTHASWLIDAGAPLPFVQARLGHESITTTINTYGHLLPDAHVQMSEIMADTLAGVLEPRLALEA